MTIRLSLPACVLLLTLGAAYAESRTPQITADLNQDRGRTTTGEPPRMSDIPIMKQQGERMAVLMEQLSKESDPDIRRKIMAEAVCPQ